MTQHVALQQELTNYQGQNVEADVCDFSLPEFWHGKSEPTLAQGTGELVARPDLPHFALLARLYHGVEATCCQAERNFYSLSTPMCLFFYTHAGSEYPSYRRWFDPAG